MFIKVLGCLISNLRRTEGLKYILYFIKLQFTLTFDCKNANYYFLGLFFIFEFWKLLWKELQYFSNQNVKPEMKLLMKRPAILSQKSHLLFIYLLLIQSCIKQHSPNTNKIDKFQQFCQNFSNAVNRTRHSARVSRSGQCLNGHDRRRRLISCTCTSKMGLYRQVPQQGNESMSEECHKEETTERFNWLD